MTADRMNRSVAALLLISAILLGILVPGGPIETRDFSHIAPLILGLFNTFLTILGLASFALAYFCLKGRYWAFQASAICGISYFLVYALDLSTIFPTSPIAMPKALFTIEVLGMLVSFPLGYLSMKLAQTARYSDHRQTHQLVIKKSYVLLLGMMMLIGISIITFATLSAMGR